jgi:serine/threonine-protein kinase
MIAAHISEPVPPIHRAGVPPRLAQLVMRSLSKRPADRPQSARELVRELDTIMSAGVASGENQSASERGRSRWMAAAAAVAAAVIGVSGWYLAHNRLAASASPVVKRIAVLPFANASGTQDDDYFADGMSEELGATLGRVPGVQVASHSSAFSFKGKQIDVREVGRQLSVDAVLEGRVRRAGNRLRVTAQLTDVSNGLSLWSDSYERDSRDVFAVQDDIAKSIANALEVRFAQRQSSGSSTELQGTANPEAYDLYLRARYFWHQRGSENLNKSITLFTQAAQKDPAFARAYGGLASSLVLLTEYNENAPSDTHAKALAAADRALALDSTVAEAYLARGLVDVHMWKWSEAATAYRTALALDSTSSTAHQWLGELYYTLGESDSAIAQLDRARALDPLAPIPATATAYALFGARRYKDAIRQGLLAADLAPDLAIGRRVLAESYLAIGDSANALAQARRAVQVDAGGSQDLAMLVAVAAGVGRRDEALNAMAKLKARPAAPVVMLMAYSGLGDKAQALAALQQVIARHDPTLSQYPLIDRTYDIIRDTDEFKRAAVVIGTPNAIKVPGH